MEKKDYSKAPANQFLADRNAGIVDENGYIIEKEPEVIKHTLREVDFENNPQLAEEGLKVGQEIEIPKEQVVYKDAEDEKKTEDVESLNGIPLEPATEKDSEDFETNDREADQQDSPDNPQEDNSVTND